MVTTRLESGHAADIRSHTHKAGVRLDGDIASADDEDICMIIGADREDKRENDLEGIPAAEQEIVRLRGGEFLLT